MSPEILDLPCIKSDAVIPRIAAAVQQPLVFLVYKTQPK